MKWLPKDLGSLFFDNKDMNGIMYWFETIMDILNPKK